ncbi:hypothetical protein ACLB2K_076854 [Fragaria x ananassa]
METITFFISLLVLFASLYYFFCKIIRSPRQVAGYQLPPGSTGWPIIGETLEYLSTARDGVPEKFIADRRKKYSDVSASSAAGTAGSCKVFKTLLLGEPMAMLCTADGNKFLFSNENKLIKTWWPAIFAKLFADSKKVEYSQVTIRSRKAVFPFFKPDSVRRHIGVMDQVTKDHFGMHWSSQDQKQVIKFHSLAKKYTLALSCILFLNVQDPEVLAKLEESIRHINKGLVSLPVDLPGTNFNRAIRVSNTMKKEIEGMVVRRKKVLMNLKSIDGEQLANAPQDLMSSLLLETHIDGEELTEEEIAKKLCGVILAGYDSIINTLCSTVIFLSQLPAVYDAVLKEQMEIAESKDGELLDYVYVRKMKYTWHVVCEVLRLQPPTSGTFREAMSDFVYEGYLIPKGMKIHWNVHATHKNPEYFPDPHKFDPSRFEGHGPPPYSYVPFGGGPRMCPGKEHARYEILVFLHNLVTKFKWEMVYPDEKMVVDPVPFPSKGLPLHVFPRI